MKRSRYTLLISVGLLGGFWLSGCTRSTVLPPAASIGGPFRQYVPTPAPLPRTVPPQVGSANPWNPPTTPRVWKYVVIHHTASKGGSVESIHEAHLQRKDNAGNPWLGIGYHFVIGNGNGMGDGAIEPTFRWKQQMHGAHAGAANKEHNEHGIGVCLVGNFEQDAPTAAQRAAVKRLVQTLKAEYSIPANHVIGHRDIRATACPGRLFPMTEIAADDPPFPYSQNSDGPLPDRMAATPGSPLR